MGFRRPTPYNHPEAFCRMRYRDMKTGESEVLWNSRDGVTPFITHSKDGNKMQHIDWEKDVCDPFFVPPVGSRIFVTMTLENARDEYTNLVEKFWDGGNDSMTYKRLAASRGMTKEELITSIMEGDLKQNPGAPHVVTVTQEMHDEFKKKAEAIRSEKAVKAVEDETDEELIVEAFKQAKESMGEGDVWFKKKDYVEAIWSYEDVIVTVDYIEETMGESKKSKGLRAKAEKKKSRAQSKFAEGARKVYAESLREHFLDQNLDIEVSVKDKGNKTLKLEFVLFNDVWVHNFKKGTLITEIQTQGFTKVIFYDGWRETWTITWK